MLQVRVVCPADLTEAVVARLRADIGCVTLTLQRGERMRRAPLP